MCQELLYILLDDLQRQWTVIAPHLNIQKVTVSHLKLWKVTLYV